MTAYDDLLAQSYRARGRPGYGPGPAPMPVGVSDPGPMQPYGPPGVMPEYGGQGGGGVPPIMTPAPDDLLAQSYRARGRPGYGPGPINQGIAPEAVGQVGSSVPYIAPSAPRVGSSVPYIAPSAPRVGSSVPYIAPGYGPPGVGSPASMPIDQGIAPEASGRNAIAQSIMAQQRVPAITYKSAGVNV